LHGNCEWELNMSKNWNSSRKESQQVSFLRFWASSWILYWLLQKKHIHRKTFCGSSLDFCSHRSMALTTLFKEYAQHHETKCVTFPQPMQTMTVLYIILGKTWQNNHSDGSKSIWNPMSPLPDVIQLSLHYHRETKWPLYASSNESTMLQWSLPSLGHVLLYPMPCQHSRPAIQTHKTQSKRIQKTQLTISRSNAKHHCTPLGLQL